MKNNKKFEHLINIKRDFLKEISGYERRLIFVLFVVYAGLIAYFYKNPSTIILFQESIKIGWWIPAMIGGVVILFYEAFYLWFLENQFNNLKKEIEKGEIKDFDLKYPTLIGNFLFSMLKKKKSKAKKK